jgi:hypothetical protein
MLVVYDRSELVRVNAASYQQAGDDSVHVSLSVNQEQRFNKQCAETALIDMYVV